MRAPGSGGAPLVAAVLPPNEGFSPEAAGAIALVVHRLAGRGRCRTVVVGPAPAGTPFPDTAFRPVPRLLLPVGSAARYRMGVARVLAALLPDIVEVHNRPRLALALARRFPAIPVLLVLHNDPQAMRGFQPPAARATLLERLARIVAVSDWVAERLTDGIDGGFRQPAVVPNAIDRAALPAPSTVRQPLVLYVGRLVPEKGADAFVAACAAGLPAGWRAEMIGARRLRPGERPGRYQRDLRAAATAAGVTLAGYRPHHAVLERMAAAAIVVVPSRWPEPFGLAALEAMGCGAALICAPRGNLPALAGGAAMLVDPDDTGALAAAIAGLAEDPPRRLRLAAAGMARAAAFDVARAVAAMDAVRFGLSL